MEEKEKQQVEQRKQNEQNIQNNDSKELSEIESLKEKIKELEEQLKEWQNNAKYIKAAFENYKYDSEKALKDTSKRTAERIVRNFIDVLEDFRRAFKHYEQSKDLESFHVGVSKIYSNIVRILENEGLKRIELSGTFDPFVCEAVEKVESEELPEYSIVEVYEDGYRFHEKVLKPAKVKVAVRPRKIEKKEEQKVDEQNQEGSSKER